MQVLMLGSRPRIISPMKKISTRIKYAERRTMKVLQAKPGDSWQEGWSMPTWCAAACNPIIVSPTAP